MKTERIRTTAFQIGETYSRVGIAAIGCVTPPRGPRDPYWSTGIVEFQNAFVLLVTLEKDNYAYEDYFEGREFWWQSQNKQTQKTRVIQELTSGVKPAHLFVRLRNREKGITQPFFYCGQLSKPAMEGERPVTCLFESLDFMEEPPPPLQSIYRWKPRRLTGNEQHRRRANLRKRKPHGRRGQGIQLNVHARKALEKYGMDHAKDHYKALGYRIDDTSPTRPYDLECHRHGQIRRVEVKCTQNAGIRVRVTAGEVREARNPGVITDLYIVHSVSLAERNRTFVVSGGQVRKLENWIPEDEKLIATEFQYTVPEKRSSSAAIHGASVVYWAPPSSSGGSPLESIKGIGPKTAAKLRAAGIPDVETFLRTPGEKLTEISGFGADVIRKHGAEAAKRKTEKKQSAVTKNIGTKSPKQDTRKKK